MCSLRSMWPGDSSQVEDQLRDLNRFSGWRAKGFRLGRASRPCVCSENAAYYRLRSSFRAPRGHGAATREGLRGVARLDRRSCPRTGCGRRAPPGQASSTSWTPSRASGVATFPPKAWRRAARHTPTWVGMAWRAMKKRLFAKEQHWRVRNKVSRIQPLDAGKITRESETKVILYIINDWEIPGWIGFRNMEILW